MCMDLFAFSIANDGNRRSAIEVNLHGSMSIFTMSFKKGVAKGGGCFCLLRLSGQCVSALEVIWSSQVPQRLGPFVQFWEHFQVAPKKAIQNSGLVMFLFHFGPDFWFKMMVFVGFMMKDDFPIHICSHWRRSKVSLNYPFSNPKL